ncbi:probable xyloglucan endotransglucosylase/hydrolase protein 30 [Phalaenopsis equestris]|uniref:probable xyloglucan endotransglucosylase/hydrolase protein 30 n=1 Tax=Phalaenopsis equestris TaxID=78828 RepID=UPI0009E1E120|nr:probable xyloglucan endotransglucosylase/hydrolase protein 30 [Phalaenopsis equestris]
MSIPSIALAFLFAAAAVAATADAAAFNVSEITFDDGYLPLFGERNLLRSPDGRSVKILLNQRSGSGFISSDLYYHGLFSASIKLPSDYTAGVVVAFYVCFLYFFGKIYAYVNVLFRGYTKIISALYPCNVHVTYV